MSLFSNKFCSSDANLRRFSIKAKRAAWISDLSEFAGTVILILVVDPSKPDGAVKAHFRRSVSDVKTHNVLPNPILNKEVSVENDKLLIGRSLYVVRPMHVQILLDSEEKHFFF